MFDCSIRVYWSVLIFIGRAQEAFSRAYDLPGSAVDMPLVGGLHLDAFLAIVLLLILISLIDIEVK